MKSHKFQKSRLTKKQSGGARESASTSEKVLNKKIIIPIYDRPEMFLKYFDIPENFHNAEKGDFHFWLDGFDENHAAKFFRIVKLATPKRLEEMKALLKEKITNVKQMYPTISYSDSKDYTELLSMEWMLSKANLKEFVIAFGF